MVVAYDNLFAQARRFQLRGQVTEAIAAYRDIAALASESHEQPQHCQAIFQAGRTAAMAISDATTSYYHDALRLLAEALQEAITLGDLEQQGVAYREMAVAADAARDFANAAVFFQKGIELLERANAPAELGYINGKLGAHLGRLGQIEGGIRTVEKALEYFRQEPLAGYYQAVVRLEQGVLWFRDSKPEEARQSWEEAHGWFVADHGDDYYLFDLTRLFGLLALLDSADQPNWQKRYLQGLRDLEIVTAKAVRSELDQLANFNR